jgi:hypothetical protein
MTTIPKPKKAMFVPASWRIVKHTAGPLIEPIFICLAIFYCLALCAFTASPVITKLIRIF